MITLLLEDLQDDASAVLLSQLPHRTAEVLAERLRLTLNSGADTSQLLLISGLELLIKYPFGLPALIHTHAVNHGGAIVLVPHDPGAGLELTALWDHFTVIELDNAEKEDGRRPIILDSAVARSRRS